MAVDLTLVGVHLPAISRGLPVRERVTAISLRGLSLPQLGLPALDAAFTRLQSSLTPVQRTIARVLRHQ